MDPNLRRKLIVGTITAIIMAITLIVAFFINRRRMHMMRILADRLGLEMSGGNRTYPKVTLLWWIKKPVMVIGRIGGHFVLIKHFNVGKSTYHGYSMVLRNDPKMRIVIQAKGITSRLAFYIGLKRVDTGDALFDSKITIHSSNPTLASVIFSTPEIKKSILETWKNEKPSNRVEINKGSISYNRSGGLSDEKKVNHMAAMVRNAAMLADALDAVADVTRSKPALRK